MKRGIDYIGVGVGAIVFNEEGKVLLAKRGPKAKNERGKWEFPGGSLEFGKKCADGLKREFKEEFDIDIEVKELIEVCDHIIHDEKQHWVAPSFIAVHIKGVAKIMEPKKITDIQWIDIAEIDIEVISLVSRSNLLAYKKKYGHKAPTHILARKKQPA